MVVFQCAGLHRHVAFVLHYHRVGDRVANFNAARGIGRLLDCQLGLCFNRRHFRVIRCGHFVVLRILAGRGRRVVDLARVHIRLGHCVGIGDRLRSRRRQVERCFVQRHQAVFQLNILHRHVAAVRHFHRVGDRAANFNAARGISRLLDCQGRTDFFRIYRISRLVGLAFQRRGYSIRKAARSHVGRLDDIGGCGRDSVTGRYIIKCSICQRYALDFRKRNRFRFGVDILYRDGKCYSFAFRVLIIVCLTIVLRYDQAGINVFIRNRQLSNILSNFIVVFIDGSPINGICIIAFAYLGLGASYCQSNSLVFHQSNFCCVSGGKSSNGVIFVLIIAPVNRDSTVFRQGSSIVFFFVSARSNGDRPLRDLQLARFLCDLREIVRNIISLSVKDLPTVVDGVPGFTNIGQAAAGRRFHGVALCQAFQRNLVNFVPFAARSKRSAVVHLRGGRRNKGGGACGNRQCAKLFGFYSIVGFLSCGIAPVNFISIVAGANLRLAASSAGAHFFPINQADDFYVLLGQGGAVIRLFIRTRGNRQFRRLNKQTAVTDKEIDVIILVSFDTVDDIPDFSFRNVEVVIAGILLIDQYTFSPLAINIVRTGIAVINIVPNIVKRCFLEGFVTDNNIVFLGLFGVCEARRIVLTRILVLYTGIKVRSPAVGLDTDGDIEFGHFQGAAEVPEKIIIIFIVFTGNLGILGSNRRAAGIQAAFSVLRVGVGVIILNRSQAVALQQAFHDDLIRQRLCLIQRGAVIRLGTADSSDGGFLLIEEGEFQISCCGQFIGDDVSVSSRRIAVRGSFHHFIQFPAGNGRTAQIVGVADFHVLFACRRARNGIPVHIDIVDSNLHVLELRIVERDHVALRIRGKNQHLGIFIREEFNAVIFRVGGIQRGIVHRRGKYRDGGRVAVNPGFLMFGRHRNFRIFDQIPNPVTRRSRFCGVYEGDFVRVACHQRNRLGSCVGAQAGDGNGLLGDDLARLEIIAGNNFIRRQRGALFIHIMDNIAQRLLAPVGINGGVLCDLESPIVEISAFCRSIPAFEGVARFDRIRFRGRGSLVLFHGLAVCQRGSAVIIHEGYCKRRRRPLSIEH